VKTCASKLSCIHREQAAPLKELIDIPYYGSYTAN
jgi:hypothetical protein